jgi:8-oxo-dGTP pyrophosphatase MutT (NUDIX family)
MEISILAEVLRTLRSRLATVEQAETLMDMVEGQQPGARKAAVLLALFEEDGVIYLAFIRRASTLRSHSGEIAFPGGGVEPGDASLAATAMREAQEEIGLDPARVEVLGALSPVFTVVSNYLIVPVVAYLPRGLGQLALEPGEVTELILAPLRKLADPAIARTEEWTRGGRTRTIYFYDYGVYHIWGATGRILHAFLHLLDADC